MISPFLIGLLLVPTMTGMMFLAKSELDLATQVTARSVMTGQITTSAQIQSSLCANVGTVLNCSRFMVNMQSYSTLASMQTSTPTLTYNANGSVSNAWTTNFGTAGSLMVLQVMYQFPAIQGPLFSLSTQSNGTALMISTAVFVNE